MEVECKGVHAHTFTDTERVDAVEALAILKALGANLRTAAQYYEKHHQKVTKATSFEGCVEEYISTNAHLVVFSNTTPVTLSTVIPTNAWTRFDIYCDYAALTWNLSVNKTNVCAGLPLYANNRQFDTMQIQNQNEAVVYIDEITATDIEPATDMIDGDSDGIPDWWEQKYFSGITAAVAGNLASNGVNTLWSAYIAGLNPLGTDRFLISGATSPGGPLSWAGQPGRYYSVYWTTNLTSGFTLLQANIPWSQNGFIDAVRTNVPAGFYQVRVGL